MSEVPPEDWSWVNAAADRFEQDWKQGCGHGSKTTSLKCPSLDAGGSWTSCCGSSVRSAPGKARNRLRKSTASASRNMPR